FSGCSHTSSDKPAPTHSRTNSAEPHPTVLAMAGQNLSAEQVSDLEAALTKTPDDLDARTKLLGYYMFRSTNSEAKIVDRKHVLWIIENHPEAPITGTPFCQIDAILDPDGFREAKQLWEDQIKAQSNDVNVIGHAAQFFLLADSARAE